MRSLHRLLTALVLSLPLLAAGALPASAQARPAPSASRVPEIDPGLLGGVVTLLAGGLLILRERRRG